MLNTQRRDAPWCATWGRKRGSSYMQRFLQRFSPTPVLWSWHHTQLSTDIKYWHLQLQTHQMWHGAKTAPSAIVFSARELVTPVAPRWHVTMTASAPSAQGSVRDPLFFPHCLEFSANLVQTYFLTSSGSGRKYGLYSQLILMQQ